MTYLSRLQLAPRSLDVIRDIGDAAEMHRTLMRAFPQTDLPDPRAAFGVLFRNEMESGRARVIVQSHVVPDWSQLPDGYLTESDTKPIDDALGALAPERVLRFLLVANPTRKIAAPRAGETERPRNSRRVELGSDDARHQWLERHAVRSGFELHGSGPHAGVRMDRVIPPTGTSTSRRSGITVKAVRYEGRLVVTDAEALRKALESGIGPAKAYGCGLLSLARA